MTFLLFEVVVLTVLLLVAWFSGYAIGVRDTEERWSEAVARADAHRDRAASAQSPTGRA